MPKKNNNKDPWSDAPMSMFSAIDKAKYREYQRQQVMDGKEPLPPKEWYNTVYKKGKNRMRPLRDQDKKD